MIAILHNIVLSGITKSTTRLENIIIKNANLGTLVLIPLMFILLVSGIFNLFDTKNYLPLFMAVLFWCAGILTSNYKHKTELMKHFLYAGSIGLVLLCSYYFGFNLGFNLFFIVISIIPFVLFYKKILQYIYFSIALLAFLGCLFYSFKLGQIEKQVFFVLLTNSLTVFGIQLLNIFFFSTKMADYAEKAIGRKNELAVFNKFFTKRLNDKTKLLTVENNKLLDLNEAAKNFAYHVSHDLRQPLNTITSFAGLTAKKAAEIDNLPQKKELLYYNKFISSAAKRLEAFVSEVLNYSLERDTPVNYKSLDLNKNLENVISDLNTDIKENKVCLNYNLPTNITASPVQIEVLFQNLVGNSIKYKIEGKPPIIDIDFIEKNNYFEFTYSDNGRGIPEKDRLLVFEAFKSSSLNKSTDKSTGLGLSICKSIIERHKGEIWIEDTKNGGGVNFRFTIKKGLTEKSNELKNIIE